MKLKKPIAKLKPGEKYLGLKPQKRKARKKTKSKTTKK